MADVLMANSLVRRLLRKLRPEASPEHADPVPPPVPAPTELSSTRENLARGGPGAAKSFLELVIAADRAGGSHRAVAWEETASLRPRDWLVVDLATRRQWWNFPSWWHTAVERATRDASSLGVLVASFHPDGYVREAATARLAELEGPVATPALALRCGDWVPQVRERARSAFERRLGRDVVGTLESAGEVALLASRRQAGVWLATTIDRHLRQTTDAQISALVRSPDPLVRRVARAVAVEQVRLDVPQLLALNVREGDLPSRLICGRAAIEIAASTKDLDVLRRMAADQSAQLRQAALTALDEAVETEAVKEGLQDRAGSARAVAQRLVRSSGGDPAEIYRTNAAATPPSAWAVAGLGETGSRDDRVIIEPVLHDPRPRVRAEAIRALRRLDVVEHERITSFLSDPSPAVVKQAVMALEPHARHVDLGPLRDVLRAGQAMHTRQGAYRLLRARDPWTRLTTNLELLGDQSDELSTRARADIGAWLAHDAARIFESPSPELASELVRLIDARAQVLGPTKTEALRFHIGAR